MVKYVVVPYEVMDGEIDNEPKGTFTTYPRSAPVITMPHSRRDPDGFPTPQERFNLVNRIKEAGLLPGVKVVRVNHIAPQYLDDPTYIGKIDHYLFRPWPGFNEYMPILVTFPLASNGSQSFPFKMEEIETLEKAREIVRVQTQREKESTLQERVMDDLLKQRNGVLPFRHRSPNTFYH